jgi:filamentous hemagglutinin
LLVEVESVHLWRIFQELLLHLNKGGFTRAGRSLTKHGAGAKRFFPPARGNPAEINRLAQDIVDDILTNPETKVIKSYRGRFGETIEYIAPDGRGIVFDANGNFRFFREGGL